jgi:VanZ family protein
LVKGFFGSPLFFLSLQKNSLYKIKPTILPGIAWFIISTILLILPGSAFPKENWFDKIWFDKWVHIGLFGGLVFLLCWGLLRFIKDDRKFKWLSIMFAVDCLVYGIIMEFVQDKLIPNRSFDYGDIVADAVGCFAGWWLISWFYKGYKKNKPL